MTNNIALASKFQPILDEVYKAGSLTAVLDSLSKPVNFAGSNVVNIYTTVVTGLGDYGRDTGYPKGSVTGTWETLTLAKDRAAELNLDRMDDEETLGMAFGTTSGEFMRTAVIPELDAYRFSKYAGTSNIGAATPATLTASTILPAIDAGATAMDEAEVPDTGRYLFISSTCAKMLDQAITRVKNDNNGAVDRRIQMLDNYQIVRVPQTRFYTKIDLKDGSSTFGFAKASDGKDINFMMVHGPAVIQVVKFADMKIFDPDTNQDMDAWKIQFREYHDAFVQTNKVKGVYVHNKA